MTEKTSAISLLLKSRKGVAALVAGVLTALVAVGVVVAAALGKLSWADCTTRLTALSAVISAVVWQLIRSIAEEDAAEKSTPIFDASQLPPRFGPDETQKVPPP